MRRWDRYSREGGAEAAGRGETGGVLQGAQTVVRVAHLHLGGSQGQEAREEVRDEHAGFVGITSGVKSGRVDEALNSENQGIRMCCTKKMQVRKISML